jgi:hypothetical protein
LRRVAFTAALGIFCGTLHVQIESLSQDAAGFPNRFSVGLEGGYSRNSLITNISGLTNTSNQPVGGYTVAIPMVYTIRRCAALYSGFSLTQKNYQYTRTGMYSGPYEQYRNSYLQLPLAGRFSWGGKLKAFVDVGIYGAYWLSGRVEGAELNVLDFTLSSSNVNLTNVYNYNEKYPFSSTRDNRFEYGWLAGLGASYQFQPGVQFFVEGRNAQSISDQQKKYMTHQVPRYNQTYTATAGIRVSLRTIAGLSHKKSGT